MRRSTLIVVGLMIMLGLVYFFTKPDKVSVGIKKLELPAFDQSKIDRIEISGKEPIILIKENNLWFVKLARLVKADQEIVQNMLHAIGALSPSHYVTELEEKHGELGFSNDDAHTIKLFAQGPEVWSLVIGKNDAQSGRYAKLPNDKQIFAVRGQFWQILKPQPADWRDHRIWELPEDQVSSIDFMRDNKSVVAIKKQEDNKTWELDLTQTTLPKAFRSEPLAVQSLARGALSLRATNFIDEPTSLGIALNRIQISTKDNQEKNLEIYAGDEKNYLVKTSDSDQIFEISKTNIDRLYRPLSDLRDLSVTKFAPESITKISLENPKIIIEKSDDSWKLITPTKVPKDYEFDPETVSSFITVLSNLKAERIATNKDHAAQGHWLKVPAVELSSAGSKITLYLSKITKNPEEYILKGNIDDELYIVKRSKIQPLLRGLDAFKAEEFELPPIDERTKGFESLPVEVQRQILDATKKKK
jgi:hypothetical protein